MKRAAIISIAAQKIVCYFIHLFNFFIPKNSAPRLNTERTTNNSSIRRNFDLSENTNGNKIFKFHQI